VTREGERTFAMLVRENVDVHADITEPSRFDEDFIKDVVGILKAEEIAVDLRQFLEQCDKLNFNADDVRPDRIVERYNSDQVRGASTEQQKVKIEGSLAAGWKIFSAAAAAAQDKARFKSYAGEHGWVDDWKGKVFVPKSVKVRQVNVANLNSLRSFTISSNYVTARFFNEPYTLQLKSFVAPPTESERLEAVLTQRWKMRLNRLKEEYERKLVDRKCESDTKLARIEKELQKARERPVFTTDCHLHR
jgi:hypothetical protein